jgi:hypothetical protein
MTCRRGSGTAAFGLATAGVALAAAFTWWALTASAYSPGGETILEENPEATVRVALALPLATSLLVWIALHVACRRGSRAARAIGLTLAWLLVAFSVIGGFTIGMAVMPCAVALTVAAMMTPR